MVDPHGGCMKNFYRKFCTFIIKTTCPWDRTRSASREAKDPSPSPPAIMRERKSHKRFSTSLMGGWKEMSPYDPGGVGTKLSSSKLCTRQASHKGDLSFEGDLLSGCTSLALFSGGHSLASRTNKDEWMPVTTRKRVEVQPRGGNSPRL